MVVVTISAIQFMRIAAIIFSLIGAGGSSDSGRFDDRQNELTAVNNNYEGNNQRSIRNYVVTSVPYLVNNKSIISQQRPSQWKHNIFSNTPLHTEKGAPPPPSELIIIPSLYQQHQTEQTADDNCVSDEGSHCLKISNTTAAAEFNNNNLAAEAATFKPYSQQELNKILEKYGGGEKLEAEETSNSNNNYDKTAAVVYYSSAGNGNSLEPMIDRVDQHDKSKSWNLISSQNYNKNNHPPPYEDKTGWVTLEPIAWSSSQVQKWEPNQKPMWPPPSQIGNSGGGGGNSQWNSLPPLQQQLQPSYGWTNDRPFNKRPAAYQYQQQKPWNSNQNFGKPPTGSSNGGGLDILTDGQPGYFPAERPSGSYKPWPQQQQLHAADSYTESTNRPSQTQLVYHQSGGSADRLSLSNSGGGDGDGHWVLLSSTKGYSVPHRQGKVARSLNIDDDDEADQKTKPSNNNRSRTARRTVRLTVLPPIGGTTKTEITHDGMIEVESTKQTVDEAHREHLARMMRLKRNDSSANELRKNDDNNNYYNRRSDLPVVTLPKPKDEADLQQRQSTTKNNAVLAAVSAGMIPATMAMLVPLILGRRKRSIVQQQPMESSINNYFKNISAPAITTARYARAEFKNNNNNSKKRLYSNGYSIYQ